MMFVQIKTDREIGGGRSLEQQDLGSRSRRILSRGRTNSLTRATDEKDLPRSCPAKKKLKSGHDAGSADVGSAIGMKTRDRIGRVHRDGGAPWDWASSTRRDATRGQGTSSGWPGDLLLLHQLRTSTVGTRLMAPRPSGTLVGLEMRGQGILGYSLLSLVSSWRKVTRKGILVTSFFL